jgi:hypothetical protein
VASPPLGGRLVFGFGAIHAGFKISATFSVTVLQVVFVAALPELDFGDLGAILSEHHILLRVSGRSLLRFVEARKKLTTVFNLTIRGSFKLDRHARYPAPVKSNWQVFIFD